MSIKWFCDICQTELSDEGVSQWKEYGIKMKGMFRVGMQIYKQDSDSQKAFQDFPRWNASLCEKCAQELIDEFIEERNTERLSGREAKR